MLFTSQANPSHPNIKVYLSLKTFSLSISAISGLILILLQYVASAFFMNHSENLDYSRAKIAAATKKWPVKL